MVDIFSIGSMKQLPFTISSKIFVHLLFSYRVTLVKMRILYSMYFVNIHYTSGSLEPGQDSLVLKGTWREFFFVHRHVSPWHWIPDFGKRNS